MLVSIIVPVYNVKEHLPNCLNSIIDQSYKELEIILVDDGSTDGSGRICNEYAQKDKRIKVIHTPNGGPEHARNIGLDSSQGEYISFVDSDDWICFDMIEKLVESISKMGASIAMCGFCVHIINTRGKTNLIDVYPLSKNKSCICDKDEIKEEFIYGLEKNSFNSLCAKLYHRTTIDELKLRFNSGITLGEDFIFNMKLLRRIEEIAWVREPLYNYIWRANEASLSKKYRDDLFDIKLKLYEEVLDQIKSWKITNDAYNNEVYKYLYREIIGCIINEFNCSNHNSLINKKNRISKMLNNKYVDVMVKSINYKPISINDKMLFYIIKHKIGYLLALYGIIKNFKI